MNWIELSRVDLSYRLCSSLPLIWYKWGSTATKFRLKCVQRTLIYTHTSSVDVRFVCPFWSLVYFMCRDRFLNRLQTFVRQYQESSLELRCTFNSTMFCDLFSVLLATLVSSFPLCMSIHIFFLSSSHKIQIIIYCTFILLVGHVTLPLQSFYIRELSANIMAVVHEIFSALIKLKVAFFHTFPKIRCL